MGAGTTAVAAVREGRYYIGSDISLEYCQWAEERAEAEMSLVQAATVAAS